MVTTICKEIPDVSYSMYEELASSILGYQVYEVCER